MSLQRPEFTEWASKILRDSIPEGMTLEEWMRTDEGHALWRQLQEAERRDEARKKAESDAATLRFLKGAALVIGGLILIAKLFP